MSADPFLRADPIWINAQRLGARSGSAFEVTSPRASGKGIALAIALAAVVAVALLIWEQL
jgi:hypothetical protein